MQREHTNMREAISVEKRIGIGLFKLCSAAEDRVVAIVFGVGRSTVNTIYREFAETVVDVLEPEWARMMAPNEMNEHVSEFYAMTGFPQAMGALDGCHFPLSPPHLNAEDYRNYKGWYSVILLAVVDHKYRFRYVSAGSPGRCHDSHVYSQSDLAETVERPLFKTPVTVINGTAVPPIILCDQAFALTGHLMKPFPHNGPLQEEKRLFNYHLSKTRRIVENAFGRMKARFRYTMKRMECEIRHVPVIIRACCTLNNMCEDFGARLPQQWLDEVSQHDRAFEQPAHTTQLEVDSGASVRAALVHYFQQLQ
ncbi:uncharacterized protein LOC144120619 [Amblyomma americanum]